MNVLKVMNITINETDEECVVIRLKDYNDFMFANYAEFQKLHSRTVQLKKREEKQDDVESRRIEHIKRQELREQEHEERRKKYIEMQIIQNKYNNERLRKEKEEVAETHKEILDSNPEAKIQMCRFCKKYRINPIHFVDTDGKKYLKSYNKDNQYLKAACCVTCYDEVLYKKEERRMEHTYFCNTCQSTIIAFGEDTIIKHNSSIKHKKNENKQNYDKQKTTINLELLSLKELQSICSKSSTEEGTYLISNYTKTKKQDLIKKMYDVYDKLVFDFY